jgi:hypothetical protein
MNRSPRSLLQTSLSEIKFSIAPNGPSLVLRASLPQDASLQDAERWALFGEGYESEREALENGERFHDALTIALASLRIGVNFGDRSGKSQFTAYGLRALEGNIGQRTLNDVHGLMAYRSEAKPRFASMEPPIISCGTSPEGFEQAFLATIAHNYRLTDREKLAFSLFNSSFFQPVPDSRFLLLMMSVETLLELQPMSQEALNHVNGFIAQIKNSALDDIEKRSLIGRLEWMLDESIRQGGRRLVKERLGERVYSDKPAQKFFSDMYDIRSNLVHGKMPFPTFHEVGAMAANAEVFVSHLLTAPYVNLDRL